MKDHLESRLAILKSELELGKNKMAELEKRRVALEAAQLRISGAIQLVEELLADPNVVNETSTPSAEQE